MHERVSGGALIAFSAVVVPRLKDVVVAVSIDILVAVTEVVAIEFVLVDIPSGSPPESVMGDVLVASEVTVCAAMNDAVPITATVANPTKIEYATLGIR